MVKAAGMSAAFREVGMKGIYSDFDVAAESQKHYADCDRHINGAGTVPESGRQLPCHS